MNGMSNGEGAGMYLGAGGAKRIVDATDGIGSQSDASSGHTDMPCIEMDAITTANEPEIVNTPPKKPKLPDLPVETTRWVPGEQNGCSNHADASSVRTDAYCIGNSTETAVHAPENVRTRRNRWKMQGSPIGREIATPELANGWRKVSIDDRNVYVLQNAPIETAS